MLVFVLCLVAAVACLGQPNGGSDVALAAEAGKKPNILLILTDDADLSLFPKMPQIEKRMVRKGTIFPNTFAPFATCCPSRATILRGQYPHNTGVISNYGIHGGVGAFEAARNDADNLAIRLDTAGYRTGLFGKYVNGYTGGYVPPGWDVWHGWAESYASGKIYEYGRLSGSSDGRTYVEYETGERELYDLRTDPHQLRSLHEEPERAVEQAALSARLQALQYCSGKGCRDAEKPNPRLRCTTRPTWRALSPAEPRIFMQLGVIPDEALRHGGVWERGICRALLRPK